LQETNGKYENLNSSL